jgi:hypothetical protein
LFLREKNSDILQFRFKNHQVTKVRLLNETLNIKEIYDEEVERYPIQQKNLFSLNFVYKCDYFLWWIVEMSHIWKFVHAYSSFADLVNLQTPFSGWRGVLDYRIPSKQVINIVFSLFSGLIFLFGHWLSGNALFFPRHSIN